VPSRFTRREPPPFFYSLPHLSPNLTHQLILDRLLGHPDGVLDRSCVRPSMRHHRHAIDAEQRRGTELPPVDAAAEPPDTVTDQRAADLALERARNFVAQAPKEKIRGRLGHLDGDVADEAVGDDHIRLAAVKVLRLDVADEATHRAFQTARRLFDQLVALALFLTIAEQANTRLSSPHHLARVNRAHRCELHHVLGL